MKNISNIPGWRTRRRIVVFESDDWGSIRTSSIEAVKKLIYQGIDFVSLDARRYSFNDSLATSEDLEALFSTLLSVKDCNSHPAVFTAISLVANPDFKAIREDDFHNYHYEPFTETLKKYPGCENSFALWRQGIDEGIFIPQFHGREHLNVISWMNALRNNHTETMEVFREGMWGYVNSFYGGRRINYQEAFNIHDPAEINILEGIIVDGLNLFEKLFGFRAELFVAPNGAFPNVLERCLFINGIKFISQAKIQKEPVGYGKTRKAFHYPGMKNKWGQVYMTRNCFFEPCSPLKTDWTDSCLNEIANAFWWNKPAIISSHRVNYIGSLNIANRQKSLQQLNKLLHSIKQNWSDVEFMSSVDLGNLMLNSKNGIGNHR